MLYIYLPVFHLLIFLSQCTPQNNYLSDFLG